MFLLAALAFAQGPYDPEIESLLRRRDERRQAEAVARLRETTEAGSLASVLPREIAERLSLCLTQADVRPQDGLAEAERWTREHGGPHAAQCKGYAQGKAGHWAEAASAFEAGAAMAGLDTGGKARLWSQAGNAALAAGDVARALASLDRALAAPLPATLATGEIHLDRARARVAAGDEKGARADLDKAVAMAAADPLAWLLSATLARRMRDLPLARQHIEKAAGLARNDGDIALEQGVIYALSGDRDPAARAAFSRAREVAGTDGDLAARASAYLAQLAAAPAAAP